MAEKLTPKQKRSNLIEDFRKEITSLENIAKAIHAKGITAGGDGTIDIRMSAGQLRELAEVKSMIFEMKKKLIDWEQEIEDDEFGD